MAQNHVIIFDTETGGLDPEKNPIMELALVVKHIETWQEVTRWESLVKPYDGLKIDQKALDVHGISVSEAEGNGLPLKEFVSTMIQIFKKFTPKADRGGGRPILAGHNVPFDIAMLKSAFSRAGEDLDKYVLSNNKEIIVLDTLPLSKFVWPGKDLKHTLGECCKRAGLGDFIAHRAMPDVIASGELFEYFRNRFNMGKAAGGSEEKSSKTVKPERVLKESPVGRVKFQI